MIIDIRLTPLYEVKKNKIIGVFLKCKLLNVFAKDKLNGNGLTVFFDYESLLTEDMFRWTREMRQFESIFVRCEKERNIARIFTMEEELDFAGHPLLGLA